MSVLAVKTNSRFGRSPIIYLGIPGVPSFLLPIMTLVPCGVRFSWVYVPFSGLPQMFGWLISLTLIPVLDIHSSWVCYPYTGNISFFGPSSVEFPIASSQESAWVSPMDVFLLEFSLPQCESFTPQLGLQSDFCYYPNQSRVLFTLCQFCFSPTWSRVLLTHSFSFTIPNKSLVRVSVPGECITPMDRLFFCVNYIPTEFVSFARIHLHHEVS
jgi:hypothetical protein